MRMQHWFSGKDRRWASFRRIFSCKMLVKFEQLSTSIKISSIVRRSCKEMSNVLYFLVLHCKHPALDLGEAPTNLSLLKVPARLWVAPDCEAFERLVPVVPLLLISRSSSVVFIV